MNSSTEFTDYPRAELQLAQVDPPNPFKSAWKTFAIAAVSIILALAIFVYFIHRPPVAAGQILQTNFYSVHSTESGGGDAGMQGTAEPYDQLIILANVRVRNQTDIPLFLQDISAAVTLPDGSMFTSVGVGARDFERVFQAFPSLGPLRSQPFDRSATLNPGESTEGLAVFSFPVSRQQWDTRKSGEVRVSFLHQNNLALSFPQ